LEKNAGLDERLENYGRLAADFSAKIEFLDRARLAIEVINKLRDVDVPLVGDGWRVFLELLALVSVDGAKVLDKLEKVLRELTEPQSSLDSLSGLPKAARAAREFEADPGRCTLKMLALTSATATPSMSQLHADLGRVVKPLNDVAGKLGGLVRGLRSVAGAGIPAVSDGAKLAAENIGLIEEPMLELSTGLDQLYQDIGADAQMLQNIQKAARQARERE
ncbi:MAG: hypothetical protein GY824_21280, partial [Delftia sp.]|nr:hypothetical protein [Delftia sp.]